MQKTCQKETSANRVKSFDWKLVNEYINPRSHNIWQQQFDRLDFESVKLKVCISGAGWFLAISASFTKSLLTQAYWKLFPSHFWSMFPRMPFLYVISLLLRNERVPNPDFFLIFTCDSPTVCLLLPLLHSKSVKTGCARVDKLVKTGF